MSNMINKIKDLICDPAYRLSVFSHQGLIHLSDEEFIRKKWKYFYGKEINLDDPKTLCEKLQWLKLYDRKPEYTKLVDKYDVKSIVADKIGEQYIIPTIGVWDSVDEIDFDILPDSFILKVTHSSGGMVVCRNKNELDIVRSKKILNRSMKSNYYLSNREWPYKHVIPRIIAEPLIEELGKPDSIEYKITCFNGHVGFVTICTGIAHTDFEKRNNDHFDKNLNKLDFYVNYKPAKVEPLIPKQWNEMIRVAELLAKDIPYVRVDMYVIDEKVLFGELTFFTWGGYMHFQPVEWDLKLGNMLMLPEKRDMIE